MWRTDFGKRGNLLQLIQDLFIISLRKIIVFRILFFQINGEWLL